jgi:hypothetical protein
MSASGASTTASSPVAVASAGDARPYPPSWLNRLLAWIDALPGPTWLAYTIAALISTALGHAGLWETGLIRWWTLDPALVFWGIYLPAQVWLIEHLDGVAHRAFAAFRPAVDLASDEAARLEYELTVIPARPALAIALVVLPLTLLGYAADPVGAGVVGYDRVALAMRALSEWFVGAVLLVFVYHTLRQLRLVSRLHALAVRVDPFQPRPLYAFSNLTSRTGIGLLVLVASGLVANPLALQSAAFWTIWAPWLVGVPLMAVAIFVGPLYGMHRRLSAEKDAIQRASDERLTAILVELNEATDARDVARAEGLQKLLASQLSQREVYARLPTWPWSTGTLRGFASAMLLPIVLFLVQRYLGEVLAR